MARRGLKGNFWGTADTQFLIFSGGYLDVIIY